MNFYFFTFVVFSKKRRFILIYLLRFKVIQKFIVGVIYYSFFYISSCGLFDNLD